MSGDWLKMRTGLLTHPKVRRMATALKADKLRIIGGLFNVWCIFDEHTADGALEGYSFETMDDELHWRGFSEAMGAIGWLVESESGLQAPEFDEHMSKSAKRRALDMDRKRSAREADPSARGSWNEIGQPSAPEDGQPSARNADAAETKSSPEKNKRREEKKNTPPASRVPPTNPNPPEPARKPSKKAPRDFALTPEMRAWAAASTPGIDDVTETEKFMDHEFRVAHSDWPGTWRNWMRNAAQNKRRNGHGAVQTTEQRDAEARRLLGFDKPAGTQETIDA